LAGRAPLEELAVVAAEVLQIAPDGDQLLQGFLALAGRRGNVVIREL
jgi:hypothetical protein